ncbi:hypothetical protein Tco_0587711 [Tanacetum coccineum]
MQRLVFKHSEHSSRNFLPQKGYATDLFLIKVGNKTSKTSRAVTWCIRRELLENLDTLETVIHKVVNTYAVLRMKENELNALKENGSQLHDELLHEHHIKSSVKMQSQDIQINPVQAMDDSLIVSKGSLIEPENNNAFSKSKTETQMQRQEEKVNMREAVDAGLVVTESSGTTPDKQDTSSSSGNYTTQAVDADIRLVNDDEPFAEVICQSFKGKTRRFVTKKTDISYVGVHGIQIDEAMLQIMSVHISSGLVLHLDVIQMQRDYFCNLNLQDEMTDPSLLRTVTDWNGKLLYRSTKLQRILSFSTFSRYFMNTNSLEHSLTLAIFPSIYIQLFWNTLTYDAKTGVYSCQT